MSFLNDTARLTVVVNGIYRSNIAAGAARDKQAIIDLNNTAGGAGSGGGAAAGGAAATNAVGATGVSGLIARHPAAAAAIPIVAVGAGIAYVTSQAQGFERATQKVWANTQLATKGFGAAQKSLQAYRRELLAFSNQMRTDPLVANTIFFRGINAGFSGAGLKNFASSVTMSAQPTGSDPEKVAQALALVMNSFHFSKSDPKSSLRIMDYIHSAAATGQISDVGQLINYLPRAAALAGSTQSKGGPIGGLIDLLSVFTALTKLGNPVSQTSTMTRGLYQYILKPSGPANTVLEGLYRNPQNQAQKNLYGDFSQWGIKNVGLVGILKDLHDANLTSKQLLTIMPGARSGTGLYQLVHGANNINLVEQQRQKLSLSAPGTTELAWNQWLKTTNAQMTTLKVNIHDIAIVMGGPFNDALKTGIRGLNLFLTPLAAFVTKFAPEVQAQLKLFYISMLGPSGLLGVLGYLFFKMNQLMLTRGPELIKDLGTAIHNVMPSFGKRLTDDLGAAFHNAIVYIKGEWSSFTGWLGQHVPNINVGPVHIGGSNSSSGYQTIHYAHYQAGQSLPSSLFGQPGYAAPFQNRLALNQTGIPNAVAHIDFQIPKGKPFTLPNIPGLRYKLLFVKREPWGWQEIWCLVDDKGKQIPNSEFTFEHMQNVNALLKGAPGVAGGHNLGTGTQTPSPSSMVGRIYGGGATIGIVGDSGGNTINPATGQPYSDGPHLHFAAQKNAMNAFSYLGYTQNSGAYLARIKKMFPQVAKYWPQILAASKKYGVNPFILASLMAQESGGNINVKPTWNAAEGVWDYGLFQYGRSEAASVHGQYGPNVSAGGQINTAAAYLAKVGLSGWNGPAEASAVTARANQFAGPYGIQGTGPGPNRHNAPKPPPQGPPTPTQILAKSQIPGHIGWVNAAAATHHIPVKLLEGVIISAYGGKVKSRAWVNWLAYTIARDYGNTGGDWTSAIAELVHGGKGYLGDPLAQTTAQNAIDMAGSLGLVSLPGAKIPLSAKQQLLKHLRGKISGLDTLMSGYNSVWSGVNVSQLPLHGNQGLNRTRFMTDTKTYAKEWHTAHDDAAKVQFLLGNINRNQLKQIMKADQIHASSILQKAKDRLNGGGPAGSIVSVKEVGRCQEVAHANKHRSVTAKASQSIASHTEKMVSLMEQMLHQGKSTKKHPHLSQARNLRGSGVPLIHGAGN